MKRPIRHARPATPRAHSSRARLLTRIGAIMASLAALSLSGCSVLSRGFLAPGGPVAHAERHEFFFVSVVMLLVIGPVILLAPLIAWHYRLANTKSAFRPQWGFSWILEGLIWIPPTIIVIVLAVFLVQRTEQLDPYRAIPSNLPPLQVDVVSLDWKWLFIYPELHIASVNQLILPANRPVHMSLTSGTVMQSLLMPRLAGQIYAMTGMVTQLNLAISEPGTYWGENAQYNGDGFVKQKFQVMGVTPADFSHWVASVKQTPKVLDDKAYHNLSQESTIPQPITFGTVEPGIFAKIVHQVIPPGDAAKHEEAKYDG
ncbi:MAG: cytochrome ubiquinol oxidase subunit II [Proteobacteria bacterium]|nr:cytochrome ubiquinol oxidase subunit II [Pseudomonadota bacterium]